MRRISTLYELHQLIGHIMNDETHLFSPVKNMDDNLNVFKVYEKTIELASNHFQVEISVDDIPFFIKFNLVNFVINEVHGVDGVNDFLKKIYSTPFDSDSKLLTAVKSDYIACTILSNLGCLTEHYEWPYLLLSHMHKHITSLSKIEYQMILYELSYFLDSFSWAIQRKLYNDGTDLLNHESREFALAFMNIGNTKKEDTIIYKRLSAWHPEILRVYDQAVNMLQKLQQKKLILV